MLVRLRAVSTSDKLGADTLSDWTIWSVVEQLAKQIGIERFDAHDLRHTYAKLCRTNGSDSNRFKFYWGIRPFSRLSSI